MVERTWRTRVPLARTARDATFAVEEVMTDL
jgi:hypothetical protein